MTRPKDTNKKVTKGGNGSAKPVIKKSPKQSAKSKEATKTDLVADIANDVGIVPVAKPSRKRRQKNVDGNQDPILPLAPPISESDANALGIDLSQPAATDLTPLKRKESNLDIDSPSLSQAEQSQEEPVLLKPNPKRIQPEGTVSAKPARNKKGQFVGKDGLTEKERKSEASANTQNTSTTTAPTSSVSKQIEEKVKETSPQSAQETKSQLSQLQPAPTRLAGASGMNAVEAEADAAKYREDQLKILKEMDEHLEDIEKLLKGNSEEKTGAGEEGGGFLDALKNSFGPFITAVGLLKMFPGTLGKVVSSLSSLLGLKSLLPGAGGIDLPDGRNKNNVPDAPDSGKKYKQVPDAPDAPDKNGNQYKNKPGAPKPASSGGLWNKVKSVGGAVIQHVPKALGALPGMLTGAASAAPLAVTAGAVVAAGAAGYAVGSAINYGMNKLTSSLSDGKYESVGEALADKFASKNVNYEGTNKILANAAKRGGILFAMEEGNLKDQGINIPKDFKVVDNKFREIWNKNELTEEEMKKLKDNGFVIPDRMKVKGSEKPATPAPSATLSTSVETKKEEPSTSTPAPAATQAKPVSKEESVKAKAKAMDSDMDSSKEDSAIDKLVALPVSDRTKIIEQHIASNEVDKLVVSLGNKKDAFFKGIPPETMSKLDKSREKNNTTKPQEAPKSTGVESKDGKTLTKDGKEYKEVAAVELDRTRFSSAPAVLGGKLMVRDNQTKQMITMDEARKISSQPKSAASQQVATPVSPPEQSRVNANMTKVGEATDQGKNLDAAQSTQVNSGGNSTTTTTNINNSGSGGGSRTSSTAGQSGMDVMRDKLTK